MSKRKYPRQIWVLLPSFKPKEVTVPKQFFPYRNADNGDVTETGRRYTVEEMFNTKEEAIKAGWAILIKQGNTITKRLVKITKKCVALTKAAKDMNP